MTSTFLTYQRISRDYTQTAERLAERTETARQIDEWRSTITSVKSVDEFVDNPRLYRFAMTAFGLESQIFAKGLIRKVLEEGTDDPLAMANRLTDKRFKEFAEAFSFKEGEAPSTADPVKMEQIVNRFVVHKLETSVGEETPGARLALYFEREAPKLTSWFQVLADRALSEVVRTVLRLPAEVAGLNIDRYAAILEERLDFEDFKDPAKLDDFIKRFTILHDLDNAPAPGLSARAALAAPLDPRGAGFGLSADLMLTLAQIRRR